VKKTGMKELLDPSKCKEHQLKEVERCMQIGLLCTQYKPEDRPTMAFVHAALNDREKKLPTPKQPSYTKRSSSRIASVVNL
jgi:L1 cell adhesion molecule like protein